LVTLNNLFQSLSIRGKEFKNRIFSTGHMAVMLDEDLSKHGISHHIIGDCLSPRTVEEAILEGLKVGIKV